jgi:hypothetical protein
VIGAFEQLPIDGQNPKFEPSKPEGNPNLAQPEPNAELDRG